MTDYESQENTEISPFPLIPNPPFLVIQIQTAFHRVVKRPSGKRGIVMGVTQKKTAHKKRATEKTEWAVFAPAFWDEGTLVARASNCRWIYPVSGFFPELGRSYHLTLTERISQRTQRPYYVGCPSDSEGVRVPPPELVPFLERIHMLEHDLQQMKTEKTGLLEELIALHEENTTLHTEMKTLHQQLLWGERSEEETEALPLTQRTLEKMLKHCSLEDFLGNHPKHKQQQVYRRLMQFIHPDKTRDFGEKMNLILEALVKAVNTRYR